jgi:hypothetical protein
MGRYRYQKITGYTSDKERLHALKSTSHTEGVVQTGRVFTHSRQEKGHLCNAEKPYERCSWDRCRTLFSERIIPTFPYLFPRDVESCAHRVRRERC